MSTTIPDERLNLPSASGFDTEFRCTGKRKMCQGLPNTSSKAAKRGTEIHAVLEGKVDIDTLCRSDQITAGICQFREGMLVEKYSFEGAKILREKRIFIHDDDMKPIASAKSDCIHIIGKRALVADYKTGFSHVVPIRENWQMKMQAVTVRKELGVDQIAAALIHPHHPDMQHQDIVWNADQIDSFETDIRGFLGEIEQGGSRTPNSVSCQYCPAKAICPEFQAKFTEIETLKKLGITPLEILQRSSPFERGERLNNAKLIIGLCEEVEDACKAMLKIDNKSVDGWKIQETKRSSIDNPDMAKALVAQTYGMDVAHECTTFDKDRLVDLLEKKLGNKKRAKDEAERVLAPAIIYKPVDKLMKDKK